MLSIALRRGVTARAWLAPWRGPAGAEAALQPAAALRLLQLPPPPRQQQQQQRRGLAGGAGGARPQQGRPQQQQRARFQPRSAPPPRAQSKAASPAKSGPVLPPVDEGIVVPGGLIRLIDHLGVNRGIVPLEQGVVEAKKHGLNLVQVSDIPKGSTDAPVCKVLDMSKYIYELKKKETVKKELDKARERAAQFKELKFGTSIGDHDLDHKLKQGREFLEKNYSLRVTFMLRRSMVIKPGERQDKAFELLAKAGEYFASCGREATEQRKVLPNQVRSVFIPAKGSPHSPTHPKAHASAAALKTAAEHGDLHAAAAVAAEAAARAAHVGGVAAASQPPPKTPKKPEKPEAAATGNTGAPTKAHVDGVAAASQPPPKTPKKPEKPEAAATGNTGAPTTASPSNDTPKKD
jgi:translation initiation factor IF-3